MAQAFTYDDRAMREDLLDLMTNIDPTDMQLVSGLAKSEAKQIRHEWLIKTLGSVKDNAYIEGVDPSYDALSNPARIANYTQILQEAYHVTESERAVNTAAFSDRFAEEARQALVELKNDLEYAIVRGSLVTGTGTAARKMRGIKNSLSLVTSQSGVSMSERIFNDYLQNVWTAASVTVNAVYGGMYIKRKITGFLGAATAKNVSVDDKRLVNAVDIYEGDASKGPVKLFVHRHVTVSGDTNYDILGINENFFKIAYLTGRTPKNVTVAPTGDAAKGYIVTEATLENLHYNCGFISKAHL